MAMLHFGAVLNMEGDTMIKKQLKWTLVASAALFAIACGGKGDTGDTAVEDTDSDTDDTDDPDDTDDTDE